MKAIIQYSIKKSFTIISVILFSALIFTSCEKVEDDFNSKSTTVIEGRTEMVLIKQSNWQMMDGQMSAFLPSTFYNANEQYEYLKVYSEESNNSANDGNYNWVEMPNSIYTFFVEDSKIIVQTQEENPGDTQFLIAIKVI